MSFCEINKDELAKVEDELKYEQLTLTHLGRIFGQPFWQLIVICLTSITIKTEADKIHIHLDGK